MTDTQPDRRLWRVEWTTYRGTPGAATLCTEHTRRNAGALLALALPAHRARPTRRGRCRNCHGTRRPVEAIAS